MQTPTSPHPNGMPDAGQFCPIYYPQTGEGLKDLARRLAPLLSKSGWQVLFSEGDGGDFFLELKNKEGRCRRLSPDETLAWQALLPQLSGLENLFSNSGPDDRKDL